MKRYVIITVLLAMVANVAIAQTDSLKKVVVPTVQKPAVDSLQKQPNKSDKVVSTVQKPAVDSLQKQPNIATATQTPTIGTVNASTAQIEGSLKKRKRALKIDREINKAKFVFKGETMVGLAVSYGTLDTEDTDIGLILDNIQFSGTTFSVKPFFGYFYRDNNCLGLRLGYTHNNINLGNTDLNLGEANDIDISLSGIKYDNSLYSIGLLHRTYVAFDRKGRFSFFAEWELSGSYGRSEFSYRSGDSLKGNISDTYKCKFSFNPGVAAYIFPNVCASISFGMGGLHYTHIKQTDLEGNFTGKRNFSKLRFRMNLADINIGVCIHLWSKKKEGSKK